MAISKKLTHTKQGCGFHELANTKVGLQKVGMADEEHMLHAFHKYIHCIFRNGWMDCRDAFHAALCLYCCITDKT